MAITGTQSTQGGANGITATSSLSTTANFIAIVSPISGVILPGAGTLNQSSSSAGTITSIATPTITTGQLIDVYWATGGGGYRSGCVVGSVSGNSVPITGGVGSNLPAGSATPICYVLSTIVDTVLTGNNVKQIILSAQPTVSVVWTFVNVSNVALTSVSTSPNSGYNWITGSGVTNPLSGDAIAYITVSQDATFISSAAIVGGTVFPQGAILSA